MQLSLCQMIAIVGIFYHLRADNNSLLWKMLIVIVKSKNMFTVRQ